MKLVLILLIQFVQLIQFNETFGHSLLNLFHLDRTYLNVNHGSYGSAPKYVHEKLREYQLMAELNPDRWFRLDIQNRMKTLREILSNYVHCNADDLVLIDNASMGINSILKSLKFSTNETILYYNVAYGMVKLTLEYVSKELFRQEQIIQIDLDQQSIQNTTLLLDKTQLVIDQMKNVRLIVFDHISSTPAVRFDIKTMIEYFRQQNILTLIDGAHAVGAIHLNLTDLNPDFYLSNNHKWLFSHRSSAFLYVKKSLQTLIHPIITSFGYLQSYQNEFFWLGTKDYSAFLTIQDALEFRQSIANETDLINYNHQLACEAGQQIAQRWNTTTLTNDQQWITTMNNIQLPLVIKTVDQMNRLYQTLIDQHNIFLPMFQFDQKFYCRISAQIYMELKDYQKLAHLVLDTIQSLRSS